MFKKTCRAKPFGSWGVCVICMGEIHRLESRVGRSFALRAIDNRSIPRRSRRLLRVLEDSHNLGNVKTIRVLIEGLIRLILVRKVFGFRIEFLSL